MTIQLKTIARFTFFCIVSLSSMPSHAKIVDEIIDGCTAKLSVSSMCVTSSPIYSTIITFGVPTEMTKGSKIVYQAQSDAALFLASEGKTRGIYLEAAFNHLRKQSLIYQRFDDEKLALIILTYG